MKTFVVEGNKGAREVELDESDFEKYGDMAMEAMTRVTESILNDEENGGIEQGKEFRKAYYHFYSLNVYIVDRLIGKAGFAPLQGNNDDYYGIKNWVILSTFEGEGIDNEDSGKNNFANIN